MNAKLASRLRLPKKGMIRAAPLAALPAVMRELGTDVEPILAAHGLSNQVLEDAEASIPYEAMCGVLAAIAPTSQPAAASRLSASMNCCAKGSQSCAATSG